MLLLVVVLLSCIMEQIYNNTIGTFDNPNHKVRTPVTDKISIMVYLRRKCTKHKEDMQTAGDVLRLLVTVLTLLPHTHLLGNHQQYLTN